jgi:dolichol-phosphate mannosyltransferase
VLVVIPTYNEAANIERTVRGVRSAVPAADVVIVDDASPDGTGAMADRLAADEHVHVLHRPRKQGLGVAYLAGFRWGLERPYGLLVEMDADGSHRPEDLPRLLAATATADLVLGSRWVPGGAVVNWPLRRRLISRAGTTYARLALGLPVRDATGGFRAFRRAALEKIDLGEVQSQGYCFQIDLVWRALQFGLRVVEVPITFVEREFGVSKMSRAIIAEALWLVTLWGLRARTKPLRRLVRRTGRAGWHRGT